MATASTDGGLEVVSFYRAMLTVMCRDMRKGDVDSDWEKASWSLTCLFDYKL